MICYNMDELEDIMLTKVSHIKTYTIQFLLHEALRVVKIIEIES